jgi:hypothetical protein
MAGLFMMKKDYQTQNLHIAVATNRPAGREESRPSKAGNAKALGITQASTNHDYFCHARLRNIKRSEI